MKFYKIQNYTCLVGENKEENWNLLRSSKQKYKIFHLTSFPSCYVILQSEDDLEHKTIAECARICLDNTKYRNLRGIHVDYTEISNTKLGKNIGEMFYKNSKKVKRIKI